MVERMDANKKRKKKEIYTFYDSTAIKTKEKQREANKGRNKEE